MNTPPAVYLSALSTSVGRLATVNAVDLTIAQGEVRKGRHDQRDRRRSRLAAALTTAADERMAAAASRAVVADRPLLQDSGVRRGRGGPVGPGLPFAVSECTVTLMTSRSPVLSVAEARRPVVAAAALERFARGGLHGTTVADVAHEAKISPAYVFKLFPGKEALFVAALNLCFDEIVESLTRGADAATEETPAAILDAMGGAYANLIGDRRLLMMQVHAQSVADAPEIGNALRAGLSRITRLAKSRSGGSDDEVQSFVAYGQLCHLIVTAGIDGLSDEWVGILSHGIRHPG